MADGPTTLTRLINSPPGQLVAGGILAGIVWKFFERVEAVLTDQTKFEIPVWLVGRKKFGPKVQPWPETFARVFDRVFGKKHLSWKCFARSCAFSLVTMFLANVYLIIYFYLIGRVYLFDLLFLSCYYAAVNLLPDYLSLLKARLAINWMAHVSSITKYGLLIEDLLLSVAIAVVAHAIAFSILMAGSGAYDGWSLYTLVRTDVFNILTHFLTGYDALNRLTGMDATAPVLFWPPALFSSAWLWLYAGSGFLLKAARRFDIGFDWFNRRFDIEKKPLQSIGLVAGALVAIVYWTAVIVSRVVG
jgi:hypothetical protein